MIITRENISLVYDKFFTRDIVNRMHNVLYRMYCQEYYDDPNRSTPVTETKSQVYVNAVLSKLTELEKACYGFDD